MLRPRLIVRIQDQDLGIRFLGFVELAGAEISVALKKKLLDGGDTVLKFIRYRRVINGSLGITNFLLVGQLFFF